MKKYAQIDENNICIATANLSDSVVAPDRWILVTDETVLGKRYNNGIWEEGPEPEPEPLSENDQAILDTAINTEYLVCLADLGL